MTTKVFFDLETGGLEFYPHYVGSQMIGMRPIIQIAAIALDNKGKELETFEVKVQFNIDHADPKALRVNNYDKKVWEDEAITDFEAYEKFWFFISKYQDRKMISKKGSPFYVCHSAGYNIVRFDCFFIGRWFELVAGKTFNPLSFFPHDVMLIADLYRQVCIVDLPQITLGHLAKHFDIPTPKAHDALEDVRTTIAVDKALMYSLYGAQKSIDQGDPSQQ